MLMEVLDMQLCRLENTFTCSVCGLCLFACNSVLAVLVCLEPIPIDFLVYGALSSVHVLLCKVSFVDVPENVIDGKGEDAVEDHF